MTNDDSNNNKPAQSWWSRFVKWLTEKDKDSHELLADTIRFQQKQIAKLTEDKDKCADLLRKMHQELDRLINEQRLTNDSRQKTNDDLIARVEEYEKSMTELKSHLESIRSSDVMRNVVHLLIALLRSNRSIAWQTVVGNQVVVGMYQDDDKQIVFSLDMEYKDLFAEFKEFSSAVANLQPEEVTSRLINFKKK
jgi:hypothetical protein